MVGIPYMDTLFTISGGTTARTWNILEGTLPQNVTLSAGGVLSGTPNQAGDYPFRVRVQNTAGAADTSWFTLSVLSPVLPPEHLTAYLQTDGRVRLSWPAVAQADSYFVYRATHLDMLDAEHILTTTNTFAYDSTASSSPDSATVRFYQVTTVERWPR